MIKIFKRSLFYHSIVWSKPYQLLQLIFKTEYYKRTSLELFFFQSIFRDNVPTLVFDIGASTGSKTLLFLKLGAKVISYEPTRRKQTLLKLRFGNNNKFVLRGVALSDKAGTQEFFVQSETSGFNTLSSKWKEILHDANNRFRQSYDFNDSYIVSVSTLDLEFLKFGVPDYIKIDVEGNEMNVIQGLSQPIRIISFEANLPEFMTETFDIVNRLLSLNPTYHFNYRVSGNLALSESVSGEDLKLILKSKKMCYMEIFAFLQK